MQSWKANNSPSGIGLLRLRPPRWRRERCVLGACRLRAMPFIGARAGRAKGPRACDELEQGGRRERAASRAVLRALARARIWRRRISGGRRQAVFRQRRRSGCVREGLGGGEGADGIQRLTNLPETRFADFAWDKSRQRLLAVGETHGPNHGALPRNSLWVIPAGEFGRHRAAFRRGTFPMRAPD